MSEHKEKRSYTREFKLEAVRLYESSEKSMRAIERELGITPYLLAKWVQQFRQGEAEVQRLRREVEILRQERDILKKVVVIFSGPKR